MASLLWSRRSRSSRRWPRRSFSATSTAYSDPKKPRGTGNDEPVIWVNTYGKGHVYVNALGHDVEAMSDPNFHAWLRRGVIWAARGNVEPQASLEPKVRLLPRSEHLDKMKQIHAAEN
ncbi:MAG: ThuA domain-containing protein [Isosphaeraceae bacterium]